MVLSHPQVVTLLEGALLYSISTSSSLNKRDLVARMRFLEASIQRKQKRRGWGRNRETRERHNQFFYKTLVASDKFRASIHSFIHSFPSNTMLNSDSASLHNVQHEEHQYLNLIQNIIEKGEKRADRTGTGTVSIFAPPQLRFSLEDDIFPLLTTKRVFFRAVAEELFWFIKADTNSKHLSEKGIKIWDGNGSRDYLDSIGLSHREEGDLGPVYGFQWRHFGAEYVNCKTDYTGKGVDQLQQVIDKIKNNPTDRRIILSAWNPAGKDINGC